MLAYTAIMGLRTALVYSQSHTSKGCLPIVARLRLRRVKALRDEHLIQAASVTLRGPSDS